MKTGLEFEMDWTCSLCGRDIEHHYNYRFELKDQCLEVQYMCALRCSELFSCPLCTTVAKNVPLEVTIDAYLECVECHSLFTGNQEIISTFCGRRILWNLLPGVVGGYLVVQVDEFGDSRYLRPQVQKLLENEYNKLSCKKNA